MIELLPLECQKMKHNLIKLIATAGFVLRAGFAYAQIPVTDILLNATQLTSSIETAASWASQYAQMADQYKKQLDQLKALTSQNSMSSLASNMTRQSLPSDFPTQFDRIRSGGVSGGSAAAQAIYNNAGGYNCASQFPTDTARRVMCESRSMTAPQSIALMNTSMQNAQARQTQIGQLLSKVDSTNDAKAAADLANRIQVELSYMNNEKMLMDIAVESQKAQAQLTAQTIADQNRQKMMRSTNDPFSN